MSQTSYSLETAIGMVGMFADSGEREVLSFNAEEIIPLGVAVVRGATDTTCRLPSRNVATVLFDADFVASNVINMSVNGVAISPVTYASSHAATFAALIVAISALANVTAVAGTGRAIVISTDDKTAITVSGVVVTLGGSQAGSTTTYSTTDIFLGVSCQEHTVTQTYLTGVVQYAVGATVPVLSRGRVYVAPEQNVTTASAVYARDMVDGAKVRGAWRADSDSPVNAFLISRARWMAASTAPAITVLEVNLP